jgi:transcriptional regulator with XRE-family HTH domain
MNKLREARFTKRIRQIQLQSLTGINQARISVIENGYVEPRDDEKKKLAKGLGVTTEDLFPSD